MAKNWTTHQETSLGGGIDSQSPKTRLKETYSEVIENMDVSATGSVKTRAGYICEGGALPLRATKAEQVGDVLCITLDESLDFSDMESRPVLVAGRTSEATGGEYDVDSREHYYTGFTSEIRKDLTGGGTEDILEGVLNNPLIQLRESLSNSSRDNSMFLVDALSKDVTTDSISVTKAGDPASIFVVEATPDYQDTFVSPGSSISILSGTHNLPNTNLIIQTWEVLGDDRVLFIPDEVIIGPSGDITVQLVGDIESATVEVQIVSASADNFETGTAPAEGSLTITTTPTSSLQLIDIYLEETVGGDRYQVIPDSVTYDTASDLLSIEFTNSGPSASFEIYWKDVQLESNVIKVEVDVTTDWVDENPDIVVWGLIAGQDLPTSSLDEGRAFWTHWLDTYRSEGENRPVAALQGSPMELLADDSINLSPRMLSRVAVDKLVRPAFGDTASGARIESDSGGLGYLDVQSIMWDSGTSVDIVVQAPGLVVNSLPGTDDWLTISNTARKENSGTFQIEGVVVGVEWLTFTVTNTARTNEDWDEPETGATAAIFTDTIEVLDSSIFLRGDSLLGQGIELAGLVVLKQVGTTVHLSDVLDERTIPGGLRVWAERTLSVLPLMDESADPSTLNVVAGSMVSIGNKRNRVEAVRTVGTLSLTLEGTNSDEAIEATISSTASLRVGGKVLLSDPTGVLDGEHVVTDIPTATTFFFENPGVDAPASVDMFGNVIELDSLLDVVGLDTEVTSPGRWHPIGVANYGVLPKAKLLRESASNQSIVRSTMSRDSLFMTNGVDPVMGFDGSEVGRAGLPRWQGMTYINQDTSADGRIVVEPIDVTITSTDLNVFTYTIDDKFVFKPGDIVGAGGEVFTIEEIGEDTDGLNTKCKVSPPPSSSGTFPTLSLIREFRYYARFNYVDANGGVVTGPAIGSEDFSIQLADSAAVNLKFTNMPTLDNYPGSLELSIFRTKANQNVFYLISNLSVDTPTISFSDSTPDDALVELDSVSTALEGVELGNQWDGPTIAKHITSIDGRLVLANTKDWPSIDYRLLRDSQAKGISASDFDGTTFTLREDNTAPSGQIFEFTDTSADLVFVSGIAPSPVVDGETCYVFVESNDEPLTASGYHVAAGGNITLDDLTFDGTVKVATVSVGNIPVFVNRLGDVVEDHNMPSQELFSAENNACIKLAHAINYHQTTLDEAFVTAHAGGSFAYGQIILKQPKVSDLTFEGEWDFSGNSVTSIKQFANQILRTNQEQVSALTILHPSRLLVSETNFPSLFTLPDAALDVSSRGVIDVNADDGQTITGISSFFGDSTTQQSIKQGILVVFKENAIYTVDTNTGQYQKLETEGKGCTVPGSITSTKNGIMFANESGIYRLSSSMQIVHAGFFYEKQWRDVALTKSIAAATYWKQQNRYLLSYVSDSSPVSSTETLDTASGTTVDSQLEDFQVVAFDMNREDTSGIPSASTYTNLDALLWANWDTESIFASRRGLVLRARNADEDQYRDENRAIPSLLRGRALHFGSQAIRKTVGAIISPLTVPSVDIEVEVSTRADLDGEFVATDTITVEQNESGVESTSHRIVSSSPSEPRGTYLQVQWSMRVVDGFLELSSYSVQVAGLSDKGTQQAGG